MISRSFTKAIAPTEATIFSLLGSNPFGVMIFIHNTGTEQITYRMQKANINEDASFQDLVPSTDGSTSVTGLLEVDEVASIHITDTSPFLRLMASATSTSELFVGVSQYSKNTSGLLAVLNI